VESGVVHNVTVLSVDPIAEDHVALREIFGRSEWSLCPNSKWKLTTSHTAESALETVRCDPIPILLCGCDHEPNIWKEMLDALTPLANPPLLIVTSRTADERLWAEALNLGAYDVLAKPYDQAEVIRVVSLAWLHWKDRRVPGQVLIQSKLLPGASLVCSKARPRARRTAGRRSSRRSARFPVPALRLLHLPVKKPFSFFSF
jgi:DNA-binding NtrC family response regulator